MNNHANPHIQKMTPYCPPLADRAAYSGLRLDFNERTIPPPPKIKEALSHFSLELYPEYFDLPEKIAQYAGVSNNQVMVTNGSDQGIELIFRTFTQYGDRVIIPTPSFAMYDQCAAAMGNEVIRPLYREKDLSFPFEEILEAINPATKLVVLCNPNNPTGTPITLQQIEAILKKASDSMVYVDEAYYEFSQLSAVSLLQNYPNLIITRTFSKAFGIPSLRVGYSLSNAENIQEMLKIRGPYDVNMAGACAARAALDEIDEINRYAEEVMKKSKPMVEEFLRQNGIEFYPSQGNFILFRPKGDVNKTYEQLRDNGILTRPRKGPNIAGTIRFCIGTVKQMEQFIDIFKKLSTTN